MRSLCKAGVFACALFTCSLFTMSAGAQTRPVPVILDTDIGDFADDPLTLALILQSPELDLKLVTTVSNDAENRTRFVWKELTLFNRRDIPIATGAPEPLLDPKTDGHILQSGLLTAADQAPPAAFRRAPEAIVDTLMKSPVKMTLIPIGPLTNIALALKTEPRIKDKIERIVLMGGGYFPARREYNIYRDRVAAQIVFASGIPITAAGLDVTEICQMRAVDVERLKNAHSPAANFLSKMIGNDLPVLFDPVAAAVAIRPSLLETETGAVTIETNGETVFAASENGIVRAGKTLNIPEFLKLFVDRLTSPPRGR